RRQILEVVTKLLINAHEAIKGQGKVAVRAHQGKNYSILIAIADNGPGMPPDQLPKIFEPYFTTKEKGTGLGLAIVKHNTEIYGGTVQVESELGKGTRFILDFPAKTVMKLRK